MVEGKGKVHPRTGHEGPEGEKRYSSTLSLTSALNTVGGQCHALAALPPGKTRYPLYRRLGEPRAGVDGCGKSRPPPGFDPRPTLLITGDLQRGSIHPCRFCTIHLVSFIRKKFQFRNVPFGLKNSTEARFVVS